MEARMKPIRHGTDTGYTPVTRLRSAAMGIIHLSSLHPRFDTAVDDSHEIGAMPAHQTWQAMRVGHDGAGHLVYRGETDIRVSLRWRSEDYGQGICRWWRLEGQVAQSPEVK